MWKNSALLLLSAARRVLCCAIALGALTLPWFSSSSSLIVGQTLASEIELVSPIDGITIVDPVDKPGMLDTYGETGPSPTWNIAQWNIPGDKLSAFEAVSPMELRAQASEAEVIITRKTDPEKVILRQDGAQLPCLENGQPRESDLLLSPNGDNLRDVKLGMRPARVGAPSLMTMSRLKLRVITSASFGRAQTDKGCEVNQGGSLVGIVLSNFVARPPQTMFYQLTLSRFCGGGPPERLKICNASPEAPAPYFTKNPFGTDDHLPFTGQHYITSGETRKIDMDILPRLRLVIESGPGEIDREPSHWVLGGVYLGQHIWGDVRGESSWSDFHLVATRP